MVPYLLSVGNGQKEAIEKMQDATVVALDGASMSHADFIATIRTQHGIVVAGA
jgi:hypothetical protein